MERRVWSGMAAAAMRGHFKKLQSFGREGKRGERSQKEEEKRGEIEGIGMNESSLQVEGKGG